MARGEARAQDGGATHEPRSPRSPRATGRPPRPVPVPTARRPVASYLGGGGGRAPGCGLRRSGGGRERAGEGPGRAGAGARGSRGAGSPGTAARRPAAPPHLQLRRGRWPRRPGRAGMSCRGRAEGGGRRREEGPAGRGGGGRRRGAGGGRPPSALPCCFPPALPANPSLRGGPRPGAPAARRGMRVGGRGLPRSGAGPGEGKVEGRRRPAAGTGREGGGTQPRPGGAFLPRPRFRVPPAAPPPARGQR